LSVANKKELITKGVTELVTPQILIRSKQRKGDLKKFKNEVLFFVAVYLNKTTVWV
jgi:hypothetical protein